VTVSPGLTATDFGVKRFVGVALTVASAAHTGAAVTADTTRAGTRAAMSFGVRIERGRYRLPTTPATADPHGVP
jgi:hypothetical protein